MFELGVRIKNIEAGSLYENNIGVREAFRYTNAVMTNSLFLDFLFCLKRLANYANLLFFRNRRLLYQRKCR